MTLTKINHFILRNRKAIIMQTFQDVLRELLNRLDSIAVSHPEVEDTAVREIMALEILNGFCRKRNGYVLPEDFGMYSEKGNARVMVVLALFLGNAREFDDLDTFHARLDAFQDESLVSDKEHDYDWFFGHWEEEDFDANGKEISM